MIRTVMIAPHSVIRWSDALLVGIAFIDLDHRDLPSWIHGEKWRRFVFSSFEIDRNCFIIDTKFMKNPVWTKT